MKAVILGMVTLAMLGGTAAAAQVEIKVGHDDEEASVAYLRYLPDAVTIHVGDSVRWVANSHTPHSVTQDLEDQSGFTSSPAFDPADPEIEALVMQWFGPGGFLLPGQTFNQTFAAPGTFTYFCKIHPGMQGTITVVDPLSTTPAMEGVVHVDAGTGSGEVTIDRFGPKEITVKAGTQVIWTNRHDSEPHTVTSVGNFDSSPNVTPPPDWFEGPEGLMVKDGANPEFIHTFTEAGVYTYFCILHPAMRGAVTVLESTSAGKEENATPGLAAPFLLLVGLGLAWGVRRLRS